MAKENSRAVCEKIGNLLIDCKNIFEIMCFCAVVRDVMAQDKRKCNSCAGHVVPS